MPPGAPRNRRHEVRGPTRIDASGEETMRVRRSRQQPFVTPDLVRSAVGSDGRLASPRPDPDAARRDGTPTGGGATPADTSGRDRQRLAYA